MLRTTRLIVTVVIGALAALLVPLTSAGAAGCSQNVGNGWGQVSCPAGGGDGGGNQDVNNTGGGGGGGGGPRVCTSKLTGGEVPCTNDDGSFDGTGAYCKVASPQPDKSHPAWAGHEDGVILACVTRADLDDPMAWAGGGGGGGATGLTTFRWAPGPPDAPTPSPRQIAQDIVVTMHLATGRVGTTPPPTQTKADSAGVIGLPIWLWIDQPGENTTGPMTRSNSGYGITVTATATLARVEWTMRSAAVGSGAPVVARVTCKGKSAAGTPFTQDAIPADGSAVPSPTCGFPASQNTQPGTYTITATAYWSIAWNGAGQSGTFDVPTTGQSGTITLTEMQALIDH